MRLFLNQLLFSLFVCVSAHPYADEATHTKEGTSYGSDGVLKYTQTKHGPDGAVFLDPFFLPFLQNVEGEIFLDAGCGAAHWAIVAAKNGAVVYGVDIQDKMIEQGQLAVAHEGLENTLFLSIGDVNSLPFSNDFFDKAISINVGCNLPSLTEHVAELKRVLKHGGSALLTAPYSFHTIFTNGSKTDYIERMNVLSQPGASCPSKELNSLDDVYRATFVWRENTWSLITPDTTLEPGEKIWRKLPNLLVPNHYHSAEEYLEAFRDSGFVIKQILHPCFDSMEELEEYNKTHQAFLGTEYVSHAPFILFIIEKP